MNGRIYDPTLGRFLQADPFIQAPGNSQSYNRYSYIMNNPLSGTDPSGFIFSKLWKGIKKFAGVIAGVLVAVYCPACTATFWSSVFTGAAIGAGSAALNGGNILKGALIGAFSGAAFFKIGQVFKGFTGDNLRAAIGGTATQETFRFGGNLLTAGQIAGQIASHAVTGGVISTLSGGKFGHGFFSAGISKGFGGAFLPGGKNLTAGQVAKGTIASALIGGTVTAISGGKFANGATTGAFQALFNAYSEWMKSRQSAVNYLKNKTLSEYRFYNNPRNQNYPHVENNVDRNVGGYMVKKDSWFGDAEYRVNLRITKWAAKGQPVHGPMNSGPFSMGDVSAWAIVDHEGLDINRILNTAATDFNGASVHIYTPENNVWQDFEYNAGSEKWECNGC